MVEAFGVGFAVDSFDSLLRQAGQSRVDMKLLVAAGLVKERQQGGYYDDPTTSPVARRVMTNGITVPAALPANA
jgi:hypothetical protein